MVQTKPAKPAQKSGGFTDEERAAMKEIMQERRSEADGESAVLAKIAAMQEPDRAMAKRLHSIIKASAPGLTPRTWYGMPAYAKDDKVVCFFQDAKKFKMRYATLGFSDKANLDEGRLWPVAYALKELTPTEEASIAALVKKAVSLELPHLTLLRPSSRPVVSSFPRRKRTWTQSRLVRACRRSS